MINGGGGGKRFDKWRGLHTERRREREIEDERESMCD